MDLPSFAALSLCDVGAGGGNSPGPNKGEGKGKGKGKGKAKAAEDEDEDEDEGEDEGFVSFLLTTFGNLFANTPQGAGKYKENPEVQKLEEEEEKKRGLTPGTTRRQLLAARERYLEGDRYGTEERDEAYKWLKDMVQANLLSEASIANTLWKWLTDPYWSEKMRDGKEPKLVMPGYISAVTFFAMLAGAIRHPCNWPNFKAKLDAAYKEAVAANDHVNQMKIAFYSTTRKEGESDESFKRRKREAIDRVRRAQQAQEEANRTFKQFYKLGDLRLKDKLQDAPWCVTDGMQKLYQELSGGGGKESDMKDQVDQKELMKRLEKLREEGGWLEAWEEAEEEKAARKRQAAKDAEDAKAAKAAKPTNPPQEEEEEGKAGSSAQHAARGRREGNRRGGNRRGRKGKEPADE